MADPRKDDELPKEEADRRRDELARRILNTPPEPRKPPGKSKAGEKKKPTK